MTTFKGVMRSYGAAVRRADRINQQHNREAAKRYKAYQKMQDLQSASQVASDYRTYVNVLKSVHLNYSDGVNWEEIVKTNNPVIPVNKNVNEEVAKSKLDHFKPSIFDKLFGLTQKKINKLNSDLESAKKLDDKYNTKRYNDYLKEVEDLKTLKETANGVLKGNVEAYREALEIYKPFDDLTELGKTLNFKLNENYVHVDLQVVVEGIIPDFEANLTSTGKLSKKDISKSKFNELNQDHICSTVIRIAKEAFAYFPINHIGVNVMINELNRASGNKENKTVLSVLMTQDDFNKLNIESINPVESIKSFIHAMKFTKTNGFADIEPIAFEGVLLN